MKRRERSPSHIYTHAHLRPITKQAALMTLTFSSSAATVAVAVATVTSSPRVPLYPLASSSVFGFVSFRLTAKKLLPPLRSRGGSYCVRAISELVQDKDSSVSASITVNETPSELNHSRTFLDARTEQDLLSGIKKESEAGRLPPNVASGMEELYWNYKNAVLSSGASRADETVISNMSVAFDRMLLGVEHPYTFSPYHKAIREPFDYYLFVHTYIRPLIDFKNSYVGNASIFSELEDKIRQGHNIVLISNHQSEADPAVISLLLEAQSPFIGENIKCVAGDRVITDPLCKPFSMGRNLICVYSKKHMNDDPELVDMKRKANTRSLKEMATMLRSGGQLIWIAPSGGRDRPDPSTGEWFPALFDSSSVDNMRRLVEHSGAPGHIYPMSLLCYDIMPPPPQVEKEIGEKRLVGFHGTGLSIAPEIRFSDVTADCKNPNEAKEAYSQALYNAVKDQYSILNSAIKQKRGVEASNPTVSLSQPWN